VIDINNFINCLKKNNLNFVTGVPDSLLKDLCFEFKNHYKKNHIISANEGAAVAIGIGYHLKTGKIPLIYLQNSGLGNMVNPLLSLADPKVFNIPLLIIMGWRGEKSKIIKDEPQHMTQGNLTENFLKSMKIRYNIISKNTDYKSIIKKLTTYSKNNNKISCLLVRKNVFKIKKKLQIKKENKNNLYKREEILKHILKNLPRNLISISTTGILSRELYEILKKDNKINNLMCVGGMGHAISVAYGIAHNNKKKVLCFDGDGAITMHLGALTNSVNHNNIIHVVFNNKSHESVGGHDTSSKHVKFYNIAKFLGYQNSKLARNKSQALKFILEALHSNQSYFIEIICKKGHRKDISRPKEKMTDLKNKFLEKINTK
tara:strand:- start:449 stop:1570 length:1122 start_codon:yes stop_codon:yes gene_type:complete